METATLAKPRNRAALYPHHVQTRIDPELQHAVETVTDSTDSTDSTRHRHALRALYELALTSPDCPPALYSTLAAHRPGRWVSLHNTRPDIRPRMTGADLLPHQFAAMISPAAHHASTYQPPAAPIPSQQPGTPEPLHDIAAIFGQAAPAHHLEE